MPEFNLIPEARSAPTSCFLCGEFEGPFVATNVDKIEGTVILCAPAFDVDGSLKRSGCVGQIAAATNYVPPLEHAAEVNASAALEVELRDAIAELEGELEAARAEPPASVDLTPLFDRLDELQSAVIDALGKVAKPKPVPVRNKREP